MMCPGREKEKKRGREKEREPPKEKDDSVHLWIPRSTLSTLPDSGKRREGPE